MLTDLDEDINRIHTLLRSKNLEEARKSILKLRDKHNILSEVFHAQLLYIENNIISSIH